MAYTTILRPQLEYCCSIWDPRKGIENNGSRNIETIQRRAARWALGIYEQTASVTKMLKVLNWRTLEQRRTKLPTTLLLQLIQGKTCVRQHEYSFIPYTHLSQYLRALLPISCPSIPELSYNGTLSLPNSFLSP